MYSLEYHQYILHNHKENIDSLDWKSPIWMLERVGACSYSFTRGRGVVKKIGHGEIG